MSQTLELTYKLRNNYSKADCYGAVALVDALIREISQGIHRYSLTLVLPPPWDDSEKLKGFGSKPIRIQLGVPPDRESALQTLLTLSSTMVQEEFNPVVLKIFDRTCACAASRIKQFPQATAVFG